MYLLDTDIVVGHLCDRKEIVSLVDRLAEAGRLGISALTRIEICIGANEKEWTPTYEFLNALETYEVDREIADLAGKFVRTFQSAESKLHMADAIIAATCVVKELTLVTLHGQCYPMPEVRLYVRSPKGADVDGEAHLHIGSQVHAM